MDLIWGAAYWPKFIGWRVNPRPSRAGICGKERPFERGENGTGFPTAPETRRYWTMSGEKRKIAGLQSLASSRYKPWCQFFVSTRRE